MRWPGSARALVTVLAVGLVGAGCSSNNGAITPVTTTSPKAGGSGALTWGSCGRFDIPVDAQSLATATSLTGLQCARLEVPLDHDEPGGPTTELALARMPATDPAERIGSIIVNPGGPGGSGLEFLASGGLAIPADLRARFDIVSFDPRGVAASSPLDCLTQEQRKELVEEVLPEDPAAAQQQAADQEDAVLAGCSADDEPLFLHMGTDQVVGDVDAIRQAVGDDQLTFLGLSYGTRIAAAYATKYPERVRAIVLDGSVTPSRDLVVSQSGQIKGIVRAFDAFVRNCLQTADCPLQPDPTAQLQAAADRLEAAPLEVTGSTGTRSLTKDLFLTGLVTGLYDPSVGQAMAQAVAAIGGTDPKRADIGASFLLDLAGQQSSERPDGTYGNGFETQTVVNCLDADGPLEPSELPKVRELAGPIPPLLDTDPATDTPSCTKLPTGDDLAIGAEPAVVSKLLVVGTEGDPATPIEWTREMVTALGDPAAIIYGGSGHTASLSRPCVTDQVVTFFVDGKLDAPRDCPIDPTESDLFAQVAKQFESLNLGPDVGRCIADELRDKVDPLGIVSLNGNDPDPKVVSILQTAAVRCR